jgi:hypothetical protein
MSFGVTGIVSGLLPPIHNCVKISLENEYYKEKLTEFYKENKTLKKQIDCLAKENDELKNKLKSVKQHADSSCQTTLDITTEHSKDSKSPISNPKQADTKFSSSKCTVCSRKSSSNQRNKIIQTDDRLSNTKTSLVSSNSSTNFDKDVYNKQNKVILTSY